MKILFENNDKVNGLLTLTIEKDDYQPEVDKTLKDYRKKANIPGFRPGQAPASLIKRQYGTAVKVDVVNKMLGEKIYEYIRENKIQMLGEPLPNTEKQKEIDMEKDEVFEFVFDIAVAPEFAIELNDNDSIDYYDVEVDDKLVDQQIDMFASRSGKYEKVEEYDAPQNDMLKGDIRELDADGNTKEDGIVVEGAVLMPSYIKVDEQKALFDGAKLGNIITFNPRKAYPENDVEVSSLLKVEKEKVAEGIKLQLQGDQDYKFLVDARAYAEAKVGELQFPTELLKKVMLNNNKDKGEKFVDENFDASIKELKWHLIKEQLVAANQIKIEDADVKAVAKLAARAQFAQYGMTNIPEEYLENYAESMLKDRKNIDSLVDRAIDMKLTAALKSVVKLNEKKVSLDEFNKMFA